MGEVEHNPRSTAGADGLIRSPEAARLVGLAIATLGAAHDDDARLQVIQDCSQALSATIHDDAIGHLSDVAIDLYGLRPDDVQSALANGQDLRRAERIVDTVVGAKPFGPFDRDMLPDAPAPQAGTRKSKSKGKIAPDALTPSVEAPSSPTRSPGTFDIDDMNREYAFVLLGRHAVIYRDLQGADDTHRFLSLGAFNAFFENRFTELSGHDGKRKFSTWAEAWRRHPDRRQYNGIEFWPSADNEPGQPGFLNFWRGFAVEPALLPDARRYGVFRDHLLTNICNGDASLFEWLWAFFANMVQTPRDRPGVAVVMRGGRGAGKTIVGETIGRLFPGSYYPVSDPRHVVGNFNAHLSACLLLQADEAVWAGSKEAEGRLKDLITSPVHLIEVKGIDPIRMNNFVHLLMTSNEKWVVPAGEDERRFAVFDVSNRCQDNHGYFSELVAELDNGGLSHLLADLLAFDLSTVNLRRIPKTSALLDQKIHSLDSVPSWWLARLMAGAPIVGSNEWAEAVPCDAIYSDYIAHCEKIGIRRRRDETVFGREMRGLMPETIGGPPGIRRVRGPSIEDDITGKAKRDWMYALPSLPEAQEAFERFVGQEVEWPE